VIVVSVICCSRAYLVLGTTMALEEHANTQLDTASIMQLCCHLHIQFSLGIQAVGVSPEVGASFGGTSARIVQISNGDDPFVRLFQLNSPLILWEYLHPAPANLMSCYVLYSILHPPWRPNDQCIR
jgi:hypothetical protein